MSTKHSSDPTTTARERVRAAISEHGLSAVQRAIGLNRTTITSFASGAGLRTTCLAIVKLVEDGALERLVKTSPSNPPPRAA